MKLVLMALTIFATHYAEARVSIQRLASRGGQDFYAVVNPTQDQSVEVSVDYYKFRGCFKTREYSVSEPRNNQIKVSVSMPPIGRRCVPSAMRLIQNGVRFLFLPDLSRGYVDGILVVPQDSSVSVRPAR